MIWNDVSKEFQFPQIYETTEKGANTCLFNIIGNDARKWRFHIKKVEKSQAYQLRQELKDRNKVRRLQQELPNIDYLVLYNLVKENKTNKPTRVAETNNKQTI